MNSKMVDQILGVTVSLQDLIACRAIVQHGRSRNIAIANLDHGTKKSLRRGRGMDCKDIRHYASGDDLRHMEWRATARSGKPHVKIYEEEKERAIIIVTNFSNSMYFGSRVAFKSVLAAKLSAMLAWFAHDHGEYLGTWLMGDASHQESIPTKKTAAILAWLQNMADLTKNISNLSRSNNNFFYKQVLQKLQATLKPGSIIIFVGDFYNIDEQALQLFRALNVHQRIMVFQIFDILEITPPPSAIYPIILDNQAQSLLMAHRQVKNAYQEFCTAHVTKLKNWCIANSVDYHAISYETDLAEVALRAMTRRAHG